MRDLPIDLQQYLPLLNTIIFQTNVLEANAKVDGLTTTDRMDISIKLLFHIVELYILKSPKNVVLFL